MPQYQNILANAILAGNHYCVAFSNTNGSVTSASQQQSTIGVFTSPVIDGGASFVSWQNLNCTFSASSGTLALWVMDVDNNNIWAGPFFNPSNDISFATGRHIQIRIVMTAANPASLPVCSALSLTGINSSSESLFFTSKINVGFQPDYILLTYNGNIDAGHLLQFGLSWKDSGDFSSYDSIAPNTIVPLQNLAESPYLKIGVAGSGLQSSPFVLDEISIVLASKNGNAAILNPKT